MIQTMMPVTAIPKAIDTIMPEVVRGTSRFMQTSGPIAGKHSKPAAHVAVGIVVSEQVFFFPEVEHVDVVMVLVVEQTLAEEKLVVDELSSVDDLASRVVLSLDVEAAVVSIVDIAVGEVDESFVVDAGVLEGAAEAVFELALGFAVDLSVVVSLSVDAALFLRSWFEPSIMHFCMNHTAASFSQPLEIKQGDISSNRKASTCFIQLGIASLSPQVVCLTKSSIL